MNRPTWIFFVCSGLLASPVLANDVVIDGKTFHVPDGFVLEKVAATPLVDRPIVADFDELGRLYVADSSGSNDNVKKQVVDRPHRIVRLEDTDGDGKFDRSVVFADKMMFPEGAMWLDGSLYVAAPPSIWKLTDTDGDGVADRREEWFQGKTLTGCANDLHGPYAGLDGRIYWCKGAFAPQTYDRPGRKPFTTRAAHLFRARPDGTEIEPVMTGGMDNPVEIAFTPEGERIFNTTFLQHPGGGKRDGLIHALYGGVYGKDHDVIEGHPRTGPDLLPPLVHLGPAAPSGLMRAESDALGSRDCLFTSCFNLRKVTRTRLKPDGGSFSAETDDFVVSDDLDFHPTDVLEDADGSLLIVDTGGWYKLCCPTSQLVKPDLLGAIYRLRPIRPTKLDDPRGRKLDWNSATADQLTKWLGDPRPAVRRRVIRSLAQLGEASVPSLSVAIRSGISPEIRRNAVWTACRIDSPAARGLVKAGLDDPDASVRQVSAHATGLWRDRSATPRLIEILRSNPLAVQRASAEALGRIGDASAIPALLNLAGEATDVSLRHSLTYALIEIDDPKATQPGLNHAKPLARMAALVALDQMEGGTVQGSLPFLNAEADPRLMDVACWVASRHPDESVWLAGVLTDRLDAPAIQPEEAAKIEALLARSGSSQATRNLMARAINPGAFSLEARLIALRAMSRSAQKPMPTTWASGLAALVLHDESSAVREALRTIQALPASDDDRRVLNQSLKELAGRPGTSTAIRIAALGSLAGSLPKLDEQSFQFLLDQIPLDRPTADRSAAANVLAQSRLENDQLTRLIGMIPKAGPIEVGRLLDAFDKAEGDEVGSELVSALIRSAARSSLRVETLKPKFNRFGPVVKAKAEALYRAIETDSADRRSRLEELLANLKGGDIRRGQAVFNGSKASCVSCHAIGYVGGKLGPDLTKIGQVRTERDLLESIVYPSASFVRSYEPISVATKEGKVISGLLRKENAEEIVVAVAADRDEHVARDRIDEIQPGTVSVMPAGLDRQLTPAELADLIAFLKACR